MRVTIPPLFFLNKSLHRFIRTIRAESAIVAWDYHEQDRKWYLIADVRREFQNAYRLEEVAELIDRNPAEIKKMLRTELLSQPSGRSYHLKSRAPKRLYWSEDDVLVTRQEFYDLLPKNKYGEPRSPKGVASRAEVISKMSEGSSYYVKNEKGEFIKIWKA